MAATAAPHVAAAHWTNLALVYALLGRDHEALAAVEEARKLDPKWSIERWARLPYTNRADRDRDLEALRRAGLE